ncbi:MAG: actin family protein [Promethearchaeota archaeon]
MSYTVVLDLGQHTTKAGFAGENHPSLVFFSIVGTPKYEQIGMLDDRQVFVGDEIGDAIGLYKIERPFHNGRVDDFPMLEHIIDYIFYNLRVDPSTLSVMVSTHPLIPTEHKKQLFKMFFEKYQVQRFSACSDALLTMYSGGFTTGTVVEIGDSCTRIIPFYEGFRIDPGVRITDIGGAKLTEFMRTELQAFGFKTESSIERELVRAIKERGCFVSNDFEEDSRDPSRHLKAYVLPDGSKVEIDAPRFRVPELLFQPSLGFVETPSIVEAFFESLEACDRDIRNELLHHIFLSGGSSMFPNLKERLQREIQVGLVERGYKDREVKVFAPKERQFSVWVGGSILALLPEFSNQWVTRAAYYRNGK